MAARVTTSVVDFAALASKIPSNQMGSFNALRGKVEKHLRNVSALPAALPNIDFAAYNKVSRRERYQTCSSCCSVPGDCSRHGGRIRGQIQSSADSLPLRSGSTAGWVLVLYTSLVYNTYLPAIDAQAKEQEAAYKQFCADSVKNIADIKTELAKWEAMKPVEEMNLEEALDAGLIGTTIRGIPNPDVPSFWPHDEVGFINFD